MRLHPGCVVLLSTVCVAELGAQAPAKRIQATDGDIVVVNNADRVRIVRRREGDVRVVFSAEQHWLVLVMDAASRAAPADGVADATYTFYGVGGDWPLDGRWLGHAIVEEYSLAGEQLNQGFGLVTPTGTIQLLGFAADQAFRDRSSLAVLSFQGAGRGSASRLTLDAAEEQQVAQARQTAMARPPSAQGMPPPSAPVRVGGNIKPPAKLVDVRPVYPQEALAARITGIVVLEAVVGPDGAVADARVIQSVPLLDAAAVEAVRQWRFEPTFLNGAAVPVIMTVTVNFALK